MALGTHEAFDGRKAGADARLHRRVHFAELFGGYFEEMAERERRFDNCPRRASPGEVSYWRAQTTSRVSEALMKLEALLTFRFDSGASSSPS